MKFKELREKYRGKYPASLVAAAVKVAMDMSGDMTGATKKIEAMKKGLSKDSVVADTLRKVNEDVNEAKYNDNDLVHIAKANVRGNNNPKTDKIIGYSKAPKNPNKFPNPKSGANAIMRIGDAKKKGFRIESIDEAVSGVRGKDGKVYKVDISKIGKKIEFRVVNQFGDIKTLNLKQAAKLFEEQDLEKLQEARRKKPKPSARERLIKSLKKHGYDVHARSKAADAEVKRLKKLYNMESNEETIELGEFTIPMSLAAKIPFIKDKVYQQAIRYYLDWRKKNPKQGSMGIAKAAKQFGVNTQKLQVVLHKLIDAGKLPKHLATNPNMLGKDWSKKYDKTVGFGAR